MNRRYNKKNSPNKKFRTLARLLTGLLVTASLAILWEYQEVPARAASLTVTQSDDGGDGVCDSTCTLRDAVLAANATSGSDTINFNSALTTITLEGEIFVAGAGGALTINGNGANAFTIDGGPNGNRIFFLNVADVTITGVTLMGGEGGGTYFGPFPGTDGGAVAGYASTVLLDGVHVTNNSPGSDGGGISLIDGHLRIRNSTIAYNFASSCGGIMVDGPGSTLQVVNSTISDNWATSGVGVGGGVCTSAAAAFRNVTITENRANRGGGIAQADGTLSLANTIVAVNTADLSFPEMFIQGGTLNSTGFNLIGDSPGDATSTSQPTMYQSTDILDTPPMLFPWGYYGGPTPTHAIQLGSPVIDAGVQSFAVDFSGAPLQTDQRGIGFPRVVGIGVDIGAFEVQAPTPTPPPTPEPATSFVVNSANDPGTGVCDATECTLREAIAAANSDEGAETITFNSAVFAAPGAYTINLSAALPDLSSDITIQGPGANILAVRRDTGGSYRIFTVSELATVTISGLTVSNGEAMGDTPDDSGGGILNLGALTLMNSTVSDNSAFFCGGGICNWGSSATAHVINSTVSNNESAFNGGGLENRGSMTVHNSTVSGNSTRWDGAGIQNALFATSCSVSNSVVSGNEGGGYGGGIFSDSPLTLTSSTVSGNAAAGEGGGIWSRGPLNLTSATITSNRSDVDDTGAENGGGIYIRFGNPPILRNSIVADNYQGTGNSTENDVQGTGAFDLVSSSFNLIGTGGSGGILDGVNSNQVGIASPGLGPLRNNGGPTETHPLVAGSSAINNGNSFGFTSDQRGSLRPFDVASDIGAYEFGSAARWDVTTPAGQNVPIAAGAVTVTFSNVTEAGVTTITEIDPATAGTLPSGYSLGPGLPAYEITTTAVYTPPVIVCFYLPGITDEAKFNSIRILHGEGGSPVDRTILPPDALAPRFASRTICARVDSLSPFVAAEYDATDPTPTPTPDSFTYIKLCKIAGSGVTMGEPFTFSISIEENGNAGPAVADVTILAGDAATGGNCIFVQGPYAPIGTIPSIGTFKVASTVAVTEQITPGTLVTSITSPTGSLLTTDISNRNGVLELGYPNGINEIAFTNAADPGSQPTPTPTPTPIPTPTPTPTPTPNTIPGTNVEVTDGSVMVTFSEVAQSGETTVTAIDPATAGSLPSSYSLGAGLPAYEITTTAQYTPPIIVCVQVPTVTDQAVFDSLRLLHGEEDMNGTVRLVDRTVLAPDAPAPDFTTRTICARVDSLSPFVVAQLTSPTYNFSGFLKPIENLPALNIASAGSSIPVKFSLGGNHGLSIFAAGYPVSSPIACDASEPGVVIEGTGTAGNSGLSFDALTGQYTYIWKTEKSWKGTCRMLVVRFNDNTEQMAKFRFR